jgi:GNAT superfamily N-acetyltransferase
MATPSRDYSSRWERSGLTHDHVAYRIRPIHEDDAARERAFITALSAGARYTRMMCARREPVATLVEALVEVDYDHSMAFVALVGGGAQAHIIGIARYAGDQAGGGEFAVAVLDQWQGRGVEGTLSKYLLVYARQHGVRSLHATLFATNRAMIELAQRLGMPPQLDPQDSTLMTASRSLERKTRAGVREACLDTHNRVRLQRTARHAIVPRRLLGDCSAQAARPLDGMAAPAAPANPSRGTPALPSDGAEPAFS